MVFCVTSGYTHIVAVQTKYALRNIGSQAHRLLSAFSYQHSAKTPTKPPSHQGDDSRNILRPVPATRLDPSLDCIENRPCFLYNIIMDYKKAVSGSIMATIGFLLSPLSWWNDAFVNIPIAYVCANIAALLDKKAFLGTLIIAYWLTNIAGLVLLHKGIEEMRGKTSILRSYSPRDFGRDLILTLIYTFTVIALVRIGVLKPLGDYLAGS